MFGVSGGELILLMLIGLIVLGPEKLPHVANKIGTWIGQARRMTRVMKRQLEDELDLKETFRIDSPQKKPAVQPAYTPPRDDDDFSPAHEPDEAGTGVGDPEPKVVAGAHPEGERQSAAEPTEPTVTAEPEPKEPAKESS